MPWDFPYILPKSASLICCKLTSNGFFARRIHWGEKEGPLMEHTTQTPEVYDFRQYDRIWQRVAQNLEPYPGMSVQPAAARSEVSAAPAAPAASTLPAVRIPAYSGSALKA